MNRVPPAEVNHRVRALVSARESAFYAQSLRRETLFLRARARNWDSSVLRGRQLLQPGSRTGVGYRRRRLSPRRVVPSRADRVTMTRETEGKRRPSAALPLIACDFGSDKQRGISMPAAWFQRGVVPRRLERFEPDDILWNTLEIFS